MPNPKDLQPPTGPVPRVITSKAGLPPRMARKVATIEGDAVINNMDKIKNAGCTCQSSLFIGNAEHVEFFLPKLGQACSCGKQPIQEEPVLDNANPTALSQHSSHLAGSGARGRSSRFVHRWRRRAIRQTEQRARGIMFVGLRKPRLAWTECPFILRMIARTTPVRTIWCSIHS